MKKVIILTPLVCWEKGEKVMLRAAYADELIARGVARDADAPEPAVEAVEPPADAHAEHQAAE